MLMFLPLHFVILPPLKGEGNRICVTAPSPSRPSGSTPLPLKGARKGAFRREFAHFLFRGGGVEGVARDGEGGIRSHRNMRLPSPRGKGFGVGLLKGAGVGAMVLSILAPADSNRIARGPKLRRNMTEAAL
jgi:hypothetical protein